MGIYLRYSAAVLILLLSISTASIVHAATLHPVPGIAKALAAGPSGVMPSGLTVHRSQQLGVMLLKSQVELALGSTSVAVTRGASLSVGALAKGAVTVLKNNSPPKLIASAVITGAVALIPGAEVLEGEFIKAGEPGVYPPVDPTDYYWFINPSNGTTRYASAKDLCASAGVYGSDVAISSSGKSVICRKRDLNGNIYTSVDGLRGGSKCPSGSTFTINGVGGCVGSTAPVPFGAADWDALESAIPASDPEPSDVQDFWFNLCGGVGSCMGSYTSEPTLVGLPSIQGPKTTTTSTGPNGTTTTTRDTKYDIDYSNPDGIVVRERTTTTTTNPDGSTKTDTTTDTGPVVVAPSGKDNSPDLDGSFADTPFPEVKPFYEQKYPDGLEGVWSARKAEFEDSAFIDFLRSFVPSFSGSCPAWSINVNVASWAAFGIHDFQTLCWVFDFVKVVLLVSAAFLCRSLIFGG